MKFFLIGPYYIYWHYGRGISSLVKNLINIISFEFHLFSVKELLLTLFSPFQRLREDYGGSPLDIETILSSFIVNVVMRLVGFFVRSVILLFAFVVILFTLIMFPIILIFWLLLPIIILLLVIGSAWAYIKYRRQI